MTSLRGERVLLRPWSSDDRAPFAALNADPRVMAHMPKLLTPAESDAMAARCQAHLDAHGFGLWALEVPQACFIGFVGLSHPRFETDFSPCVEIGWRIARAHWGKGYVTEAARLALAHGFATGLDAVVSFTVRANTRSLSVMRRLGMREDRDFDHPGLPEGHPLRRHVLYRIHAAEAGRSHDQVP